MGKPIKLKVTFKSGRQKEFTYDAFNTFRDMLNHFAKANWNIFDNYAFQMSEVESIEEIK